MKEMGPLSFEQGSRSLIIFGALSGDRSKPMIMPDKSLFWPPFWPPFVDELTLAYVLFSFASPTKFVIQTPSVSPLDRQEEKANVE